MLAVGTLYLREDGQYVLVITPDALDAYAEALIRGQPIIHAKEGEEWKTL